MIGRLRVVAVAAVLVTMTLVLWPLQIVAIARDWRLARRLPHIWHLVACRMAGIRLHIVGTPARRRPLLIAANHQSWSDIMVLGRVMPLSFIAKAEVRSWPAFGLLARLQRTVFVEREARRRTGHQANMIAERLSSGDAMVLFAEGTTSDGNEVLPFKTALFGAAQLALAASEAAEVAIQPVAIAYTHANGLPLGRYFRPMAAWPGDVGLGPHLLAFLKEGAVDVTVAFGEPLIFSERSNRKAVARECEESVRRMLAASLRGRDRIEALLPAGQSANGEADPLALRHDAVDIGG
ncbi:1-acyl-sn-glycerol-3-phosphate acyltransferase [Aurantimonas sp. VKM B-3413]|uniref:lysophospholipid acyltransferase family protein n=1 Tax=Aurantimonas sp. VKM B-3413 TaxID=2779401 RepID=UPI001E3C9908|nr:lysophospholipid acyltransferase family protein [Aurantimonas sp. VKM B-3413]MCB8840814.1 1-acyl-sn-glycerol-3-phosphate acyltransferase [Aurantimonas sp. VKM B-3413]